jgi:hypothetical protein
MAFDPLAPKVASKTAWLALPENGGVFRIVCWSHSDEERQQGKRVNHVR